MQSARREHAVLTKNPSECKTQVHKLKQEVAGMKKSKVALVTKLEGESRRLLDVEKLCNRKIAGMLKVSCWQRTVSALLRPRTAPRKWSGSGAKRKWHPVQIDFKCMLNHLQGEPKKVQSARIDHAKLTKNPSKYKIQVCKLKKWRAR
ncbi:hypothetical protein MRX96_035281 [Rhipicephalus microplus]